MTRNSSRNSLSAGTLDLVSDRSMKGTSESGTGRNVAQPAKARIKRIEGKIKKTRNDVLIAPIFPSEFRQELHILCTPVCVTSRSEPNEGGELGTAASSLFS